MIGNTNEQEVPFILKTDFMHYKETWFFVENQRCRRITSGSSLAKYKELYPIRQSVCVSSFKRGPAAPSSPTAPFNPNIARTESVGKFRENIGLTASGKGIEIGAGGRPLVTSIGSSVFYVDRFTTAEIMEFSSARYGTSSSDLAYVDFVDSIEELSSFKEGDLNFIIGCHVIEHTTNPLKAIEVCASKLKSEGKLVLIVPDATRTHDKIRGLTSVEHIVADYYMPSAERDFEHYIERLHRIDHVPLGHRDEFLQAWKKRIDTHLHTFNYTSFSQIAEIATSLFDVDIFWSHDGFLDDNSSREMYFIFSKRGVSHLKDS